MATYWLGRVAWRTWKTSDAGCSTSLTSMQSPGWSQGNSHRSLPFPKVFRIHPSSVLRAASSSFPQLPQLLQQALLSGLVPGGQSHPAEQQQRAGPAVERGRPAEHGQSARGHHPLPRSHPAGPVPAGLLRR